MNRLVLPPIAVSAALLLLFSCSEKEPAPSPGKTAPDAPAVSAPPDTGTARSPLPAAIIKSGNNPLWFEFGPPRDGVSGPFLVPSPAEAALTPYEPWPLSRLVAGMVMQRDRLVMGINREGFLVAEVWKDGGIALYRVTDTAYWDNYTIGSFFVFQDEPAALLYRNDFFTEPTAPPPAPQVFVQGKGSDRPVGIQIPAFESFPAAAGWEVDALRQGGDRHWYYRSIQRTEPEAQYAYFSVRDLSHAGAVSSVSRFRDSALPLSPDTAPALLRQVLEKAAGLSRVNQAPIAGIISPEYAYPRYFAGENALTMNDLIELSGYYHDNGDTGARALVIYPDGKGFFGESRGGAFNVEALNLPLLPEGFVYTRIGTVSDTIIAAWEEQHDLTVGAAGLMILRGAGTEEK